MERTRVFKKRMDDKFDKVDSNKRDNDAFKFTMGTVLIQFLHDSITDSKAIYAISN